MIFIEIGKYLSLKLTKFHDMKKTALVSNVVHGSCEDFLFLNSISFKFWKSVLFSKQSCARVKLLEAKTFFCITKKRHLFPISIVKFDILMRFYKFLCERMQFILIVKLQKIVIFYMWLNTRASFKLTLYFILSKMNSSCSPVKYL